MSIAFSEAVNNTGIVQQTRFLVKLDSTQWPTARIVNSANNWLDFLAGYLIGADKRFQWDDTNHTKLPEGTTSFASDSSDYSFLNDEQGNNIVTLTGVSLLNSSTGYYEPLTQIDRNDPDIDLSTYGVRVGIPTTYDKIADNVVRLEFKASATVAAGLKFYFQRTPSYFDASSTTKAPGVSPLLHRGFIIAAAYDAALTLGLPNLTALSVERQKEEDKVVQYFAARNRDTSGSMRPRVENNK